MSHTERVKEWKTYKQASYEVIADEGLPVPKDIRFRTPINGNKSRRGFCQKMNKDNSFNITISTTKATYIPDPKGNLIDKKTGQRFRRGIGTDIAQESIRHTIAHEIAHLKFWDHGPEHRTYTEHLFKQLNDKLGFETPSVVVK